MSIRLKILLPMVFVALGGLLLLGLQMWLGQAENAEVASVAERAIHAGELARKGHSEFGRVADLVSEVAAMTHFVDPESIRTRFETSTVAAAGALEALKAQALSAEMVKLCDDAKASFTLWRHEAALVLGVERAASLPVADEIRRNGEAVQRALDAALALSGRDAHAKIEAVHAQQ